MTCITVFPYTCIAGLAAAHASHFGSRSVLPVSQNIFHHPCAIRGPALLFAALPALRLLLLVRKHGYHCSNQRQVHRNRSSVASDGTSDMQRLQNLSTVLCPAASAQFLWRQQRLSRLPKKGECHLRCLQSAGEGKHLQPLPVKTPLRFRSPAYLPSM